MKVTTIQSTPSRTQRPGPWILLIDADDTLWENEGYFRDGANHFLEMMAQRGHDRESVRRHFRNVEKQRCAAFGYGTKNFINSMITTVRDFEPEAVEIVEAELHALGNAILQHPIVPFPGVREALSELGSRHRLWLVTKGNHEEQSSKVTRSGLAPLFEGIEVLPEKDRGTYQAFLEARDLKPDSCWMIGNSPRSDINPTKSLGLRTVYIPHRTIWELEMEEFRIPPDLTLRRFRELPEHF